MTKKIRMPEYKLKEESLFALEIHYVAVEKNFFGKIKKVTIIPTDKSFEPFMVTPEWYKFYNPKAGGFLFRLFLENHYSDSFWFNATTIKLNDGQ